MPVPAPDLSSFAETAYAAAGEACLALQDRYGVDVTLLLFAAWIGETRGVALDPARVAEADGWIAGWRRDVVQPLRAVRRRLRNAGAETLRGLVKAAELDAERRALASLEQQSATWSGTAAGAARPNLDAAFLYATRHAPEPASSALLADVAAAARKAAA